MLWKIQKFDWLIPDTKWHSCLHNITLCSETRIHSNRPEPEKLLILINKNIPLFDRAIICSNNSMLWRTASLFTALQYHDHGTSEMRVHIKTMAMCKQYSAGEVGRLWKHEIYWAFSGRIHFYEFPYNTYISWPLFNAVKCSIASIERV